jgi:RNA polymerase sigma-70 factor, ECF subfamily
MLSEEGLRKTFQNTVRPLYRFVSRQTSGDRELSEDIVQETFLRAVADWRKNGVPSEPLAWLNAVARNLIVDHHRRGRLQVPAVRNPSGPRSSDAGFVLRDLASKALRLVRPDRRRLLQAFYLGGRTTREIAGDLRISERAVEGRLRRARRSLREGLESLLAEEKS